MKVILAPGFTYNSDTPTCIADETSSPVAQPVIKCNSEFSSAMITLCAVCIISSSLINIHACTGKTSLVPGKDLTKYPLLIPSFSSRKAVLAVYLSASGFTTFHM